MKRRTCLRNLVWLAVLQCTVATSVNIAAFLSAHHNTRYSIYSYVRLTPAGKLALDEIVNRVESGQYANFTLRVTYSLTGCTSPMKDAVGVAASLYFKDDVAAFFGPSCSTSALVVGDLAATLNVPTLTFSANDHNLDNKARYPTLTQTTFKSTQWCPLFLHLCRRYNWRTIVVLRTSTSFYRLPSNSLEDCLHEAEIKATIIHLDWYSDDPGRALEEAAAYGRSK